MTRTLPAMLVAIVACGPSGLPGDDEVGSDESGTSEAGEAGTEESGTGQVARQLDGAWQIVEAPEASRVFAMSDGVVLDGVPRRATSACLFGE